MKNRSSRARRVRQPFRKNEITKLFHRGGGGQSDELRRRGRSRVQYITVLHESTCDETKVREVTILSDANVSVLENVLRTFHGTIVYTN